METLQLNLSTRYSYADYLTWFDEKRRELVNGFVKLFAAPVRKHQEISINLATDVKIFLKNKPCRIYHAPFDVRFPANGETEDSDIYTVVQPDISIICDKKKLDKRGCIGAPDMIIEILSKSSVAHDTKVKFELYEKHGVREYWIVRPDEETVTVFVLNDNMQKYEYISTYSNDTKIPVNIFNSELIIDLKNIFTEED